MEILIKAKQANNPLFEFLNQSSHLNPFYKHTLQALKDGNYPSEGDQSQNTTSENHAVQSGSIFQSYYNPSANQPKVNLDTQPKIQNDISKYLTIRFEFRSMCL